MDSHDLAASKGAFAASFNLVISGLSWLAQSIVENSTLILTLIPMITGGFTIWYLTTLIKLRKIEVLEKTQMKPEKNQEMQTPDQ